MNKMIVMLQSTYKDNKDTRYFDSVYFDSVSACAIHFAHEARRQYAKRRLAGDDLFDAVVSDVALLFAYSATDYDPEVVHGGCENTSYHCDLYSCMDASTAAANARADDEMDRVFREVKK